MVREKTKKTKDVEVDFSKIKLNVGLILLGCFLIFGFALRYYHISYPIIGYHNWKSAHYITEARNFANEGFFKEGFFVPMRDTMNNYNEPSSGAHYDTFPTISIIIGVFFKIFGESLYLARLINILFSIGSIIFFYLLIKELFNSETLALLSAFLATINPLYIFFSHNIQVINPGLFFMLLGSYFYVKWLNNVKKSNNLYIAVTSIILAIITKYTFAVITLPILFSFPYKKIFKDIKKFKTTIIICLLIASIFPAWYLYSEQYIKPKVFLENIDVAKKEKYSLLSLVQLGIFTDKSFWVTMKSYINDNFTTLGMNLSILGMILFSFLFFSKNKKKENYRFMFGYLVGLFLFLVIMGFKLSGHNYHQFPVAPLILFMIAYFVEVVAKNIGNFVPSKMLKIGLYFIVTIFVLFAPLSQGKSLMKLSTESKNRMFDTQFPGLDIAGYYIKEHSEPYERVFHSSGQSFGFLWHANRKGYKGSNTVDYLLKGEEEYNVTWLFAYQWGINTFLGTPEVMDHIRNNYKLMQIAFISTNGQAQPIYYLFKKGGTFNDTKINDMIKDKPLYKTQYYYTSGPYEINYINLE